MAVYDTLQTLEVIFREIKPDFFMEALLYSSEMWGVSLGPDGKPVGRVTRGKAPGPEFVIPIRYATEMGVGAIDETSLAIPTASAGARTESTITMKWMAGSTEITDIALENAKTEAAIRNYALDKLDELKDALIAYYVRAFTFNVIKTDATSWAFGVLGSKRPSSDIEISTAGTELDLDITDVFAQKNPKLGAWYIKPSMRISFHDITQQAPLGTAVVQSVSRNRKTIKAAAVGSAFTLLSGHTYIIYIEGSLGKEPTSFHYIASEDRVLQGLDPDDYAFWNGVVTDANASALSVEILVNHLDTIRNTTIGRPNIKFAFTTLKQLRNIIADFINTYNYQPNRVPPRSDLVYGGWGVEVEGVQVIYDPWVPPNVCYTPSYDTLTDYYITNLKWRKVGGQIWYPLESEMKHRAVLLMSRELGTSFAGHQGMIVNLGSDFFD